MLTHKMQNWIYRQQWSMPESQYFKRKTANSNRFSGDLSADLSWQVSAEDIRHFVNVNKESKFCVLFRPYTGNAIEVSGILSQW